ncbi:response regulator transcription factor [Macellibacteroides fermentans]|uniref:DNA-binding response regulator, OmpR family, contains REC and winged-helix (WHTH) domain n=1 Tax=Parabacteroides chartae TaxID=1037355 RepID=A0A1T5BZ51_9BACT|nr:response regulator transcription factor [Parabacteroides chartae]SKB52662.1 DNA-binding response regulator, OmpR family, contains REC and winged-helix (wHTH) domain [Parabacteroides chartae]
MKILIIEDETSLSNSIASYLKADNYLCEIAGNYKMALDKIESFDYDCILLDITLPDGNGLNVLKELKKSKRTDGVIIISAKNSVDDKIDGLNLGADDYISKPFHLSELSARISAVIRRRRFDGSANIIVNEITIDTTANTIFINNKLLDLTKKEYDLLLYLVINKNRVISKSAIAEHISGDNADYFDNFDFIYAHIKNLKKKMTSAGAADYIKSIYGMGYKFEVN